MRIDLTTTKVYLISPCVGKYQDRALAVLDHLMTRGFGRVELVRSIPDARQMIFEWQKDTNEPFLLLEDDCGPMSGIDTVIEVPDDADAVYVGVSDAVVTDLGGADSQCVRIRGMASGAHAILYTNKRACLEAVYALKHPFFYQQGDSVDDELRVVREQLGRLVERDGLHTDRGRLAYVLQKIADTPSRTVHELFVDPVIAPVLLEAKVATDCGWSPQWAAEMLARHGGAARI